MTSPVDTVNKKGWYTRVQRRKGQQIEFEYSCGRKKTSLLINIMSWEKRNVAIVVDGRCACQVKTVCPVSIGVSLRRYFRPPFSRADVDTR